MNKIIPVVGVVYKSKDGNWRGFCYPYDVSCNADSKEEAKRNLEVLMETYEEVLERHGSPEHLIEKKLSDGEDQEKFKKVWPIISRKVAEIMKNSTTPNEYAHFLSRDGKFKINDGQSIVSYSHRSLVSLPC